MAFNVSGFLSLSNISFGQTCTKFFTSWSKLESKFFDIKDPKNIFSQINSSELILFTIAGDLNRNELTQINSFIENGKKIILVLNKIDIWNTHDLKNILKNIKLKLPQNINIPIILNKKNNISKNDLLNILFCRNILFIF